MTYNKNNSGNTSAASLFQTHGDAKGHFTNKTANRHKTSLASFLIIYFSHPKTRITVPFGTSDKIPRELFHNTDCFIYLLFFRINKFVHLTKLQIVQNLAHDSQKRGKIMASNVLRSQESGHSIEPLTMISGGN